MAAITLSSCEKEAINPRSSTESSSKTQTSTNFEKSSGEPTASSTWFDRGGNDFGCEGSPTNCLEVTIIGLSVAELITDFSNSDNQGGFATAHHGTLRTVIDPSLLDNVVAGINTVKLKGTISASTTGYLVIKELGAAKMVYPFQL
ncbi:hypothetical protein Fluta_2231 [Fluviicola taffensis DSM 16823]|uniref:Uncharacterized protein n=2 Tax=Fluviicola TaxID=332102 RepID=F2IAR2_FLUTR|nr:hypothetical protein Fluta_2231 [Fluviicola taffensis DSM 16823]